MLGLENKLFPVTVRKKNRVGRSVNLLFIFFGLLFFLVKNECFMHVLPYLGVGRAEKTLR